MNRLLLVIPASDIAPSTTQPTPLPTQDPLIAKGLQKEQYVAIVALAIIIVAAVGFFSRRFEYALILAFILSGILIAFFLFL